MPVSASIGYDRAWIGAKAGDFAQRGGNEVFPSIDIARKIADILEVSLDYLTGKEDVQIDKDTSSRILEVSKFEAEDRNHIFSVIDAFIAKRKIQSIL